MELTSFVPDGCIALPERHRPARSTAVAEKAPVANAISVVSLDSIAAISRPVELAKNGGRWNRDDSPSVGKSQTLAPCLASIANSTERQGR